MRATLMEKGRLWVAEVPDPVPAEGEVLVKSIACGICGSDLHAARHTEQFVATSREAGGAFKLTTLSPVILGHEFCAEVVDYGPGTPRDLAPGTLVCSVPVLVRGQALGLGYSEEVPGGFAEYMVLSGSLMVPVPNGLSASHAALTEPMAVGRHAVAKAGLDGQETILVMGCGPVGLAVIAALRAEGAGPVLAADFSPRRRQLAEQMGAHEVMDPAQIKPFESRKFPGQGQTVIFECVGIPGMLDQIFLGAPQDARIVVVGVCLEMDQSRPLIAINKELSVQYVLGYSLEEFNQTLKLIAEGRIDVEPIITGSVSLEGVAGAFEDLADPERHAKVLVRPWLSDSELNDSEGNLAPGVRDDHRP